MFALPSVQPINHLHSLFSFHTIYAQEYRMEMREFDLPSSSLMAFLDQLRFRIEKELKTRGQKLNMEAYMEILSR